VVCGMRLRYVRVASKELTVLDSDQPGEERLSQDVLGTQAASASALHAVRAVHARICMCGGC
jgi:hypothetical protein